MSWSDRALATPSAESTHVDTNTRQLKSSVSSAMIECDLPWGWNHTWSNSVNLIGSVSAIAYVCAGALYYPELCSMRDKWREDSNEVNECNARNGSRKKLGSEWDGCCGMITMRSCWLQVKLLQIVSKSRYARPDWGYPCHPRVIHCLRLMRRGSNWE